MAFAQFELQAPRTEQQSSLVGYSRPDSSVKKNPGLSTGNNKSLYCFAHCVRQTENPFILFLYFHSIFTSVLYTKKSYEWPHYKDRIYFLLLIAIEEVNCYVCKLVLL